MGQVHGFYRYSTAVLYSYSYCTAIVMMSYLQAVYTGKAIIRASVLTRERVCQDSAGLLCSSHLLCWTGVADPSPGSDAYTLPLLRLDKYGTSSIRGIR